MTKDKITSGTPTKVEVGELIKRLNTRLDIIPDDLRSSPNELFQNLEDSLVALQSQQTDLDKALKVMKKIVSSGGICMDKDDCPICVLESFLKKMEKK